MFLRTAVWYNYNVLKNIVRGMLLKLVALISFALMVAHAEAAYQSAFVRVQSVQLQSGLVERIRRMVNDGVSEICVVAKDFGETGFVPLKLVAPASDGSVDIPIGGSPIPISWIKARKGEIEFLIYAAHSKSDATISMSPRLCRTPLLFASSWTLTDYAIGLSFLDLISNNSERYKRASEVACITVPCADFVPTGIYQARGPSDASYRASVRIEEVRLKPLRANQLNEGEVYAVRLKSVKLSSKNAKAKSGSCYEFRSPCRSFLMCQDDKIKLDEEIPVNFAFLVKNVPDTLPFMVVRTGFFIGCPIVFEWNGTGPKGISWPYDGTIADLSGSELTFETFGLK